MHNPDFKPESYPFFKFTPVIYSNGEITLADPFAQGVFMNICCLYWPRAGKLTIDFCRRQLPFMRDVDIESLVKLKAIKIDNDDFVHINFLDEQMRECADYSKTQSGNGKNGGRPSKTQNKAIANPTQTNGLPKENPSQTQNKPNRNPEKSNKNEIRQDKTRGITTEGSSNSSLGGTESASPTLWGRLASKNGIDEQLKKYNPDQIRIFNAKGEAICERINSHPKREEIFEKMKDFKKRLPDMFADAKYVLGELETCIRLVENPPPDDDEPETEQPNPETT